MKREIVFSVLITAYCLVIGLFTLKPQLIMADPQVLSVQTHNEQNVRFEQMPGVPDPNQVFDLVNKERANLGSPVLIADDKLGVVAAERAADMAKRQYYAHKTPEGTYYYDLFPKNDIDASYSCENLDLVVVPDINIYTDQWLASTKGHRECMIGTDLKSAGYAVTKMMMIEYGGKEVPAYLVVAIHTTELN